MSDGAFLDPAHAPTRDELELALGPSIARWDRLSAFVTATYGVAGEPLFFGRDSGWSVRFRRGGKALLTLTPMADGSLRALVVVGPSVWDRVEGASLSPAVHAAWEAARPYPDGRWLWLRLTDDATVDDVERLVTLKSAPPRQPRQTRAHSAAPVA